MSRPQDSPSPLCCHVFPTCGNWTSTCRLSTLNTLTNFCPSNACCCDFCLLDCVCKRNRVIRCCMEYQMFGQTSDPMFPVVGAGQAPSIFKSTDQHLLIKLFSVSKQPFIYPHAPQHLSFNHVPPVTGAGQAACTWPLCGGEPAAVGGKRAGGAVARYVSNFTVAVFDNTTRPT